MKLRISPDLALPVDTVTSTIVVFGGKGMGKTNLASVLVEEFAAAGLRFAVIDPMGVWWGLRHGLDGKGAGIKALILGGIHGDMPIDPSSGAVVADLVVDEDDSVIIDISRRPDGSMWSIGERVRFVTDYAKRLYQRQGEKRRPIHQVIDEAARFVPQVVRAGDLDVAKCTGAIAVIVEEGRNVGVGVTLVTQRSARLNKDVAELADCMIAFRTLGPNSMRAVLDWLGEHVEKARIKDVGEKLRSLPQGSALVVSPGWLEFEGIVAMRRRRTFDSSATPKVGEQLRVSGDGAKPTDLAKYRARMAEVIEQQKANDPTELKKQVVALKRELANVGKGYDRAEANEKELHAESYELRGRVSELEAQLAAEKKRKPATVEVVRAADLRRLEELVKKIDKLVLRITGTHADLELHLSGLRAEAQKLQEVAARVTAVRGKNAGAIVGEVLAMAQDDSPPPGASPKAKPIEKSWSRGDPLHHAYVSHPPKAGGSQPKSTKVKPSAAPTDELTADAALSKCERSMLAVLAQHPRGLSRKQVLIFSGYRHSGTTTSAFARLLSEGLASSGNGMLVATPAGLDKLGDYDPLPTGDALRGQLLNGHGDLSQMEKEILRRVCDAYPETVDRTTARGNYAHSGSTTSAFARLIAMNYVKKVRGGVLAAEELFG
jgi:hypothetical protein